jgi:1-acyl-sn-glycerol-3-phosphate acyltransferase
MVFSSSELAGVKVKQVEVEGDYTAFLGKGYEKNCDNVPTIVSNHVSWLDLPIFLWKEFPAFVAKAEIKNVPVINQLAYLS